MVNNHLHILHLPAKTDNDKVNRVAAIRLQNLHSELEKCNITDYTIVEGFYDPINTKQAIHKGHKLIVQLAKEQGMGNVIVAEDDLVFSSPNSYSYFLSQIPEDYDLFVGLIYDWPGQVNEQHRILNGMSGTHTLLSINSRFFDFILSQPDDVHCDRNLGQYAYKFKYYVCNPMVVTQRGGYSFNLRRSMFYEVYLEGVQLFR